MKKVIDFLFSLIICLLLVFAGLGAIVNTSTLKEIDYKVDAIEAINQRLLQHIDVRDSLMLDYTDKVLGLTQKCDTIVMVDTIYVYKFIEEKE